eukprot:1161388-Pelagomonas_calceolata.AAC.10
MRQRGVRAAAGTPPVPVHCQRHMHAQEMCKHMHAPPADACMPRRCASACMQRSGPPRLIEAACGTSEQQYCAMYYNIHDTVPSGPKAD